MAETLNKTPRMRTGVPGLDELLGGGLAQGRTALIKGAPGTGKTTMGMQMLVAGAKVYDEPGILISFEQLPQQLYADAANFGWDLEAMNESGRLRVMFVSPEDVLNTPGRQANRLLVELADCAELDGAKRVLIDSLSHLTPLFEIDKNRVLFLQFLIQLKGMGLTPILTAEMSQHEGLLSTDAYLVDSVIHLRPIPPSDLNSGGRVLEVVKTRGCAHIGGAHPYEITPHGLIVYPRITLAEENAAQGHELTEMPAAADKPLEPGVPGLGEMLAGGFRAGSVAMAAGLSGTYKTGLGAHFLMAGVAAGETGLWVSLRESPEALESAFAARGLELGAAADAERLHFLHYAPAESPLEKMIYEIELHVRELGARRLFIDGWDDLMAGLPEGARNRAAIWAVGRLAATGVTQFWTQRIERVTGRNPLSEIKLAELADTIIYVGLVEIESRLEKVVSVLKHRGGAIDGDLRSISSSAAGLRVHDRFIGMSGLLDGTALGQRKSQIEEIFQPLFFIRDFLEMAKAPGMEEAQRAGVLDNISGETGRLIEILAKYFDRPEAHKDKGSGGGQA